jgi:putative effector of murein hydrolase
MTEVLLADRLLAHPLFGLSLTIAVYALADGLWRQRGRPALLHPVLTSVAGVGLVVWGCGIGYERYFVQAAPLHYALGAFVVLLAVPLVRQAMLIREAAAPLTLSLVIGSGSALITALMVPVVLNAEPAVIASIAPKSATAAVAVGIADHLGGLPGLTAVVVIMTGIFGAIAGPGLLAASGVRDERAVGFALGLASHAIGTARAFQLSERAGAFASVGMILNALLTVALAPVALNLLAQ